MVATPGGHRSTASAHPSFHLLMTPQSHTAQFRHYLTALVARIRNPPPPPPHVTQPPCRHLPPRCLLNFQSRSIAVQSSVLPSTHLRHPHHHITPLPLLPVKSASDRCLCLERKGNCWFPTLSSRSTVPLAPRFLARGAYLLQRVQEEAFAAHYHRR